MPVSDDCHNAEGVNYRQRYRNLKRKFRYLIYIHPVSSCKHTYKDKTLEGLFRMICPPCSAPSENLKHFMLHCHCLGPIPDAWKENECFQDELKTAQRKYLKVNQDKSFLLDRLLQYERFEDSSSDSDMTISSDSELDSMTIKKLTNICRKKAAPSSASANSHGFAGLGHSSTNRALTIAEPAGSKRKKPASKSAKAIPTKHIEPEEPVTLSQGDGHMTSEEIERHLESRQILLDLLPERAPPTVPTEMFSNDPMGIERYLIDE